MAGTQFGKYLKREADKLRRSFTGEDVTFHTLMSTTAPEVDYNGDPIDAQASLTRTDNTVTVKYARVILGKQNIVNTIGGEFQDADAVLDIDASYEGTIDNTKLDKGYVTHNGINYSITHIQPITTGGVLSRFYVGLAKREI